MVVVIGDFKKSGTLKIGHAFYVVLMGDAMHIFILNQVDEAIWVVMSHIWASLTRILLCPSYADIC